MHEVLVHKMKTARMVCVCGVFGLVTIAPIHAYYFNICALSQCHFDQSIRAMVGLGHGE